MKRVMMWRIGAALTLASTPLGLTGQSAATRTPNLIGGWTAAPGVVQMNLVHRFSESDPALRKLTNTPTFQVGTGVVDRLMVGLTYGSNSSLVPAYPNEWELFARGRPLQEEAGDVIDLSVQGGYNVASESVDGEVLVARTVGRLRLLAAGRAFSQAYAAEETRYAVHGGAVVKLTPSVSVAGDYGLLLDRSDAEREAWGAGLQLGVPYTPHSLSIHASNVGTVSLEGASRGTRTRWGFEYTVPINVKRYLPRGGDDPPDQDRAGDMPRSEGRMAMADMESSPLRADTVVIEIHNLAYVQEEMTVGPGTTLVWVNRDPVQHSVIADDGTSFDSGLVDPEGRFSTTLDEVGTYEYHCAPHPFMTGRVVVQDPMSEDAVAHMGGALANDDGRPR